jgi:exodeoxyribonuclease VII large subunit
MTERTHLTLGQLLAGVGRALNDAFPLPVWVAAEVADLRVASTGHCYLELVEKGEAGRGGGAVPKAQARAVVWRGTWASLSAYFLGVAGAPLAAGMKVLVKVSVSYHELYGFSLTVSDIDPSYTLGEAERTRRETIARLQAEGVWDMNRGVGLPPVVQSVAVISSASAAGWRDFVQELGRYPWRFRVELFEAVMQGAGTEQSVVAALEAIAERMYGFDAVVVIRGGGSVTDLAAFDGYRLCSHLAQFPLPVVTGIGHDKDRSVADMVAALELKTPTAVAVWLGEGLGTVAALIDELSARTSELAVRALERERERLERAAGVVSAGAVGMTRALEMRLERLAGAAARLSGERLLRERHRLERTAAVVSERPAMFLARAADRLGAMEQAVAARRPENILALGFAIVRTAGGTAGDADGSTVDPNIMRAVLDPAILIDGQPLEITLARGTVKAKTTK